MIIITIHSIYFSTIKIYHKMKFYFAIIFALTTIEFGTNAKTIKDNLESSGDSGIEIIENSESFENSGDSENDTLDKKIKSSAESEGSGKNSLDEFDVEIAVFFEDFASKYSSASGLSEASEEYELDIHVESNNGITTRFCIILLTIFLFF